MTKKLSILALSVLVTALLVINIQMAYAHNWGLWCWHTGRTINVWVWGSHRRQINTALNDWDSHTQVNFNRVNYHTELSVAGANYGATGWWGLASIKETSYDWWHHWYWCRIKHAHAVYNSYYGGSSHDIHGVLCQEIGHTLGLDHSNHGCMGKGYYNSINHTVSHNWSDINSKF